MVILIMGVMGAGKTTVGRNLAESLGWRFVDADDLHPPANIEKLRRGRPLTGADRAPWLTRLRDLIVEWVESGEPVVLACSALQEHHRKVLLEDLRPRARIVYLKGPADVFARRLEARQDHFASRSLLPSQLESLEEPVDALIVDAEAPLEDVIARIRSGLRL